MKRDSLDYFQNERKIGSELGRRQRRQPEGIPPVGSDLRFDVSMLFRQDELGKCGLPPPNHPERKEQRNEVRSIAVAIEE